MIIGVSGKIGSGKDTVGKIIQYLTTCPDMAFSSFMLLDLSEHEYTWKIKKFAYKLKRMVYMLTGIKVEDLEKQGVKDRVLGPEWNSLKATYGFMGEMDKPAGSPMTVRSLLQKLGTDAIRNNVHPNAWVNALMVDYKSNSNWIITDCRFPNEADAILERGGFMIRVNRNNEDGSEYGWGNPNAKHESETALDNYNFKYTINNSGTIEELIEDVRYILKQEGII